jgi:polysaccharide deacetylase family protein (PEP-CTERM system associated)
MGWNGLVLDVGKVVTRARLDSLARRGTVMTSPSAPGALASPATAASEGTRTDDSLQVILSFDVEEHHRIEAAAGLTISEGLKAHYRERLDITTRWLLEQLAERDIKATFFVVGEIAQHNPGLVRSIHEAGHEVASHGWDHRRVHHFSPATFREDVRRSMDVLEQVTGEAVRGYRAPTFSIVRETAWAIDVLAGLGLLYDSSIYPVRHDRYGVPQAPRQPFLVQGTMHTLLELPPATLRWLGVNLPAGGGGYFRLLPLVVMRQALRQLRRDCLPAVAMLYFHPWEFDSEQLRLPLGRVRRFRTYVGIPRSRHRLTALLAPNCFVRARDVAAGLDGERSGLAGFKIAANLGNVNIS